VWPFSFANGNFGGKIFVLSPDSKCAQQDRGDEKKHREYRQDIQLQGKIHDRAPPSQLKHNYSRMRSGSEERNMLQRQPDRAAVDDQTTNDWDCSGFGQAAICRRTLGRF
jgi:hypothetical protein